MCVCVCVYKKIYFKNFHIQPDISPKTPSCSSFKKSLTLLSLSLLIRRARWADIYGGIKQQDLTTVLWWYINNIPHVCYVYYWLIDFFFCFRWEKGNIQQITHLRWMLHILFVFKNPILHLAALISSFILRLTEFGEASIELDLESGVAVPLLA